jgi:hypothetical protein
VFFLPGLLVFGRTKDWVVSTFGTQIGDTVVLPRWVAFVIGGPMTIGYVLLIIGLFRAVFGVRG